MEPQSRSANDPCTNDRPSAIVIGAGWVGLYGAKTLLKLGYKVTILERRDRIGGVWARTDDMQYASVNEFTEATSSRFVTEAHDFPYADSMGDFPTHTELLKYLQRYAAHFGIDACLQCGVTVTNLQKESHTWAVMVQSVEYGERVLHADRVIVAAGSLGKPSIPEVLKTSGGSAVVHSHELRSYTQIREIVSGKRVLVVGAGETSSECIFFMLPHAASVTWSTRGLHGFPKRGFAMTGQLMANDNVAHVELTALTGFFRFGKPGLRNWCEIGATGSLLCPDGHAIDEFRRGQRWGTQIFNKSLELSPLVGEYILPKPEIVSVVPGKEPMESVVTFKDGSYSTYDVIIAATGYSATPTLLGMPSESIADDYCKWVLCIADPSLAVLGRVRPTVGSFPLMAEYGCAMLEHYWSLDASGCCSPLPCAEALRAEHLGFMAVQRAFFDGQRPSRLPALTDPIVYWTFTRYQYPQLHYKKWTQRVWLDAGVLLPFYLSLSPVEQFIHLMAPLLPLVMRRPVWTDKTIYVSSVEEFPSAVNEFYVRLGFPLQHVDRQYEVMARKWWPMLYAQGVIFAIVALDLAMLCQSPAYRFAWTCLAAYRLVRLAGWHFFVWYHMMPVPPTSEQRCLERAPGSTCGPAENMLLRCATWKSTLKHSSSRNLLVATLDRWAPVLKEIKRAQNVDKFISELKKTNRAQQGGAAVRALGIESTDAVSADLQSDAVVLDAESGAKTGRDDDSSPQSIPSQVMDSCLPSAALGAPRAIRVLSLDGGGVKGYNLPLLVRALEERCGMPMSDMFDVVCGTSSGGALALLFASRRTSASTEFDQLMYGLATKCMKQRSFLSLMMYGQMVPQKTVDDFEAKALAAFGLAASDLIPPPRSGQLGEGTAVPHTFVVSAYQPESSTDTWQPILISNYKPTPDASRAHVDNLARASDWTVADATKATTAAPVFFQPLTHEYAGRRHHFYDGGVLMNNPCMVGIIEATLLWPGRPLGCVVSLGCGKTTSQPGRQRGSPLRWAAELMRLATGSDTATAQAAAFTRSLGGANAFWRLDPDGAGDTAFDESRHQELEAMRNKTRRYLVEKETYVDQMAVSMLVCTKVPHRHKDYEELLKEGADPQSVKEALHTLRQI